MTEQALGRVVATERRPNTPYQFHFWTAVTSPVGIGTIVRVDGEHPVDGQLPRIYGAVIEGFSYSDLVSPMHDVLGHDGEPSSAGFAPTERTEIRLYTAAVLRMIPEEPLQPVPMGSVFLADENDVAVALRMDSYLREGARTGIPIGIYHAGGTDAPIYLDADFLVGPEAAHLNITGVSGLATKTSAVEWLLSSLFTHFPEKKGTIAAVAFNVKGPDLCYLDQPGRLEPADEVMYEKMGVPAKPFANVRYYAAYDAGGYNLNTLRSNEALLHNVHPLTWGLREVLQYAEVLLNKDDVDAKADAVIDFIRDKIAGREFRDERLAKRMYKVESFAELDEWFRDVLSMLEENNSESYRTHHVATIRKVRNRLTNIALR
ncbi:MAG: ATP-binding protein, partial [Gemmatimonadaceae bacterium]